MTEKKDTQLEKVEKDKQNKNKDERGNEAQIESINPDVMPDIPPEVVKEVRSFMSMSMGRMPNPIVDKFTPEHISTILQNVEKDDERAYKDLGRSRWFTFGYVIIAICLFIFLTIFLAGTDKELYKEILKLGIVAATSFGGGFGVKSYLDRNR
jgi:hypothetical protein